MCDILSGRRSSKTQRFFLKYTDQVYRAPGEELWEDPRRYLELHVLLYSKSGRETKLFYHAEVPEIMLEMIHAVLQLGLLHWESQDVVCSLPGTGCSHLFHVRVLRYIHHHAFRDSEATLDKGRFATR